MTVGKDHNSLSSREDKDPDETCWCKGTAFTCERGRFDSGGRICSTLKEPDPMSNDLLKAFNAAADAAHIASLRAYNAVWDAAKAAKALHPNDECSRARHTVSNAYREVCELVIETEDIGDNVNDTPRSRGIISSAPDPKQPLKLYTWLHNNTVLTRSQVHTGSIRTHHRTATSNPCLHWRQTRSSPEAT